MPNYIYAIENTLDGKTYVGRTGYPESRWKAHQWMRGKSPIHVAIKKHGIEHFSFRVLDKCHGSLEAGLRERFWTHLLEANDPRFGYNNPRIYAVSDDNV